MTSKKRNIATDNINSVIEQDNKAAVINERLEGLENEIQELTFEEAAAEDQSLKEQEITALQSRQISVLQELEIIRSRLKELGVIEAVSGSKMAKAKALYWEGINQGLKRKEVVQRLVAELGLSVNTANTYVQKFKHL